MIVLPKWTKASNVLFYRNFNVFYNHFFLSVFEGLIQPLLYLTCFGFIMGSWFDITVVESYSKFVFTGILLCIPMSVAAYEVCYSTSNYLLDKDYKRFTLLLPVKHNDIYVAAFLWSTFKSLLIMGIFLVIGYALRLIDVYAFLPVLLIGLAISTFFSSLILYISTYFDWDKNDYNNVLYILIPLFLFSGTFFPVASLPVVFKQLALYNPIGYGIHLMRDFSLENNLFAYSIMISASLLTSLVFLSLSLRHYQLRQDKIH